MTVIGLDHVNIVARDLEASARFYADVLGLERRDGPLSRSAQGLQWMHDPAGRPIVHLAGAPSGSSTGAAGAGSAVDHVALACRDYAGTIARLESRGIAFRASTISELNVRQIFLLDPDGVKLELNFRG